MSLVPTAVSLAVERSVSSLDSPHSSPRANTQAATTPASTSQNNKELQAINESPISKIRLFNRKTPNSPLPAAKLSTPLSPLASPFTEPKFHIRSAAGSPIKISSVGANLVETLRKA